MSDQARTGPLPSLSDFDPEAVLGARAYGRRLRAAQVELLGLQTRMRSEESCSLVAVFEGVDAAGKGGAIRRLTGRLDPRGLRVYPIGPPGVEEARRPYLWRFHVRMPPSGRITIFDRSWYGRVLVERVEGLATRSAWERAYDEIVAFERSYTAGGVAIIKFWLQVTPREQLRRFEERAADPLKSYKLTDDDWRNRARWDDYQAAAEEMLGRTHSEEAPWLVVSANSKHHARVQVAEAVAARLRRRLGG
ncbi:MAG: polyphosphate kinase [Chloroflexi bacterium]|nr:polyphosphate kinase [Chloroflexota bacterium]